MEKLIRGDKIYLDDNKIKESFVNTYLDCRDGIVECYEYRDGSGYGARTRLFYCQDTKHESASIVRQVWNSFSKEWIEEEMSFDSDSFGFLRSIINGVKDQSGGKYYIIRDYNVN